MRRKTNRTMPIKRLPNMVDMIMAYETTGLPPKKEKKLFQNLVDTGMAWSLQGMYGRRATDLLNAGIIKRRKR
jgi:hypothetical protein